MITSVALVHNALAFVLAALVPPVTAAQTPVVDSTTHHLRVDASGLRPIQLVYQMTLDRDTGTVILGTKMVSTSVTSYVGSPAWLLVETRYLAGGVATDSLFATFSELTPLHWSAAQGSARLASEFRADTTYGATSAPPGRRSIVSPIPPGTLVNGAMLETVLRLQPLYATWEDSASVMSVSVSGNTVLPARLAVIGEDRVRVPAGTFDCWVVSVRADPARGLYWVSKQDPIVVRSAVDVPGLAPAGAAQLVSALTRIGR